MVTTQEPRIRFVKDDVIVAEMWELGNGKLGFYNPETDDYFTLGDGAVDFTNLDLENIGSVDLSGTEIEVSTLTVTDSFVDAANVSHSGELADADTTADLTEPGGVLVSSQLPDLAITSITVVADESERLALDAEEGDVAIQTDTSSTYILSTNDPTVDGNWKKVQIDILAAIDGQQITPSSINGFVATGDINLSQNNLIDDSSGSAITLWDAVNQYIPQSTLENDSVTVTAGSGLTGGGSVSLGSSTSLNLTNDSVTVTAGSGLTGGGSVSLGGSITVTHADTSSQGDVSTGAGEAIDAVTLDGDGHVTGLGTVDFDGRFYNEGQTVDNADNVDGYDIQKNGTDGTGIINLKTN